jgi:hypothetical protein
MEPDVVAHKLAHESDDLTFIVQNDVLQIDGTPLFRSRLGSWLLLSGWWHMAVLVNCLVVVFLVFVPLSEPAVREAYDRHGELRSHSRAHAVESISCSVLTLFGNFVLAHQMNRQMFVICVCSFDSMVIVGSGLLIQSMWFINWVQVFVGAGEWQWYDLPVSCLDCVAWMSIYLVMATIDCIVMRYSRRVCLCWIMVLSFLADFILCRLEWRHNNFFADETLDWWLISTTPQEVYLSGKLQMLLFLAKAALAYTRGQPFSCIKADYCVPGREVRVERIVRQLSDSFTPSSFGARRTSTGLTSNRSLSTLSSSTTLTRVSFSNSTLAGTPSTSGDLPPVSDDNEKQEKHHTALQIWKEEESDFTQEKNEESDITQKKDDEKCEWEAVADTGHVVVVAL